MQRVKARIILFPLAGIVHVVLLVGMFFSMLWAIETPILVPRESDKCSYYLHTNILFLDQTLWCDHSFESFRLYYSNEWTHHVVL